jgi:transcriptional regulator with XRE-family HTH domain
MLTMPKPGTVPLRNLRAVRERRMLSTGELAARAGIAKTTVLDLEHGRTAAHLRTVRKLAQALEADPAELIGEPAER